MKSVKNIRQCSLAGLICLTGAGVANADLPGMPAPAAASLTSAAQAPQTPMPAQLQRTPVRGSLFRQGVAATSRQEIFGQSPDGGNRPGASVSFTAVSPAQPRKYKKNDIITVVVREDSNASTDGKGSASKKQDFDLSLEQFIKLAMSGSGLPTVEPIANTAVLPEIKFKYDNKRSNDASTERQDSFSARISATVVDVKPNGTMIIEAMKNIVVDKEEHTIKLSGICRVEDIAADNTVLSTQLADLSVSKRTKGAVHDVNKRGWLNRLIDQLTPF
jgi:flagellar L-ring protein FlgH